MSSPATTAFLKAWNQLAPRDQRYVTLVQIDLVAPSALTLRYATSQVTTPDGNTWQEGVWVDAIRQKIDYLGFGLAPVETQIRLAKRRDAAQASGTLGSTNQDLISRYRFENADVTIWFWVKEDPDKVTLAWSDALQQFKGKVSSIGSVDDRGTTLNLLQDLTWNKKFPQTIDKVSYPDSPDVSQGLVVPRFYGDGSAPPLTPPWTSGYALKSKHEDAGGALGVLPLVLVDSGIGAASVKLLAAGHACKKLLDRTAGMSAFIVGEDALHPLDPAGITETLGSTESYLLIPDEKAIAYGGVKGVDVRVSGTANTGLNPRRAMDVYDPNSFATLDQNAGQKELQYILPNLGPLGSIESVEVSVAFIGNAGNTHNLRANGYTPGVGFGAGPAITTASTGTVPQIMTGTWPAAYFTSEWDFGAGAAAPFDLRIDFAGGTVNKASILWAVLVVKYRPQRSVVTPGRSFYTYVLKPGHKSKRSRNYLQPILNVLDPVYQLEGQFFGNYQGMADDAFGTFTGTANALIERPADIIRHLLQDVGGVSSGNIETTAGATGSFVDARAKLRNAQPRDFKMAAYIGQKTTLQRALQKVAEQSGMCVYLDRFTNKWLAFVWKPGAFPDYGRTLSWKGGDFSALPVATRTTVLDSRAAVRVRYFMDAWKNKTLYEAFVNGSGSSQGLTAPSVRDQRLVVSASNNKLDFKHGLTTYAVTLTSATYAPIDLAAEVRAKMRAASLSSTEDCGWGFSIKAGYNDILEWTEGSTYTATLAAGDYTAESLAIAVEALMESTSGKAYTVTYDHATNKFSITASTTSWSIGAGRLATNYAKSAWHAMGWFSDLSSGGVATITATYARYRDYFWLLTVSNPPISITDMNVLWSTGANAATNCATLLGYSKVDSGVTNSDIADFSRGDRERVAAAIDDPTNLGEHEEEGIVADWLRDEASTVSLRDRRFDLQKEPVVELKYSSHRTPDMRAMSVVPIDSDLDPLVTFPRYGSDGSWAGKSILTLEVEQRCGPDYSTEILGVEI